MSDLSVQNLGAAFVQLNNNFQRLTFVLERKGIITARELAEVYGELEEHDNQAAYDLERGGKP